jgi:glycosyltransferase involved in cell wall biosynthesis
VFFLIRSLERGGAERQLIELVRELASSGFEVAVCTFYDGGALRGELERIPGVSLISLGKQSRWDVLGFLWRLSSAVRAARPDIVHGYMGVANELSLLMARIHRARAIWGVRSSNMDLSKYDEFARQSFQSGAFLSRFADRIIANSQAGVDYHVYHGYPADRMTVLHNGIDCVKFCPDNDARARVRAEWGVAPDERLIGLVARLDPKKDHGNFLEAASLLAKQVPGARFVCVGHGTRAAYGQGLDDQGRKLGLSGKLIWSGQRTDMPAVYNALDVAVLSSAFGEGFPNVIGEAMAVGKPCVATNVGDAAIAIGAAGVVVPPRNPAALADGIRCLLKLSDADFAALGMVARNRIVTRFSTRQLGEATARTLLTVLGEPPRPWWRR